MLGPQPPQPHQVVGWLKLIEVPALGRQGGTELADPSGRPRRPAGALRTSRGGTSFAVVSFSLTDVIAPLQWRSPGRD
jgi:hypothetical protein